LESEVLKQQHRIDKLLSPQFAKNSHLLLEIRKEIEKSVLVRQLKAQMLSLRGTITDKEMIIESLQKKTGSAHLIELSAEKEEYFHEIQRLKKMLTQKEKELQQEKNSHAWQKKGENVTLEGLFFSVFSASHHSPTPLLSSHADNLKAEITRLSRGYQQVLERLETTTAATNASKLHQSRVDETDNHSAKPSSSRPSSGKSRRPKSAGSKASTSKVPLPPCSLPLSPSCLRLTVF
jgi:phenylalanyl-tRNA synthetase alpha subunit